jgi:Glycosyltransferase sugar-binding region containing DXD motif
MKAYSKYTIRTRIIFILLLSVAFLITLFTFAGGYIQYQIERAFTVEWGPSETIRECSPGSQPPIPKIIHQSWKTNELPTKYHRWASTWKTIHPDWEYKLWSDTDNINLVRNDFPWFLKTYTDFKQNINRADSARYLYMFKVHRPNTAWRRLCRSGLRVFTRSYTINVLRRGTYACYVRRP